MPAGSARLSGAKKGLEQHTRPMLSRTCDTCSGRAGGRMKTSLLQPLVLLTGATFWH